MRGISFSLAAVLVACGSLWAAEVQVKPSPTKAPTSPAGSPSPAPANQPLPQYRPALLGIGPASVINRIDTASLITDGQKDATISFCCSVKTTGEIASVWTYRASPDSQPLERELVRCLDTDSDGPQPRIFGWRHSFPLSAMGNQSSAV